MMPSPAGCCPATLTSPVPETLYAIPASSPLFENTQRSAAAVPEAGRTITTAFPPSAQELLLTENNPSAATSRSTFVPAADVPAVLGSTATMSFPAAEGAALESAMTSSLGDGCTTTTTTWLDIVPSGFRTCTERFPATATSAAPSVAMQSELNEHVVVREVPPATMADPGPGLLAAKPLPFTRSVNPPAAPAKTLAGSRVAIIGPVVIATCENPLCAVSSALTATTRNESGDGADAGAEYIPLASIVPHGNPRPEHAEIGRASCRERV